jgi:hypothetical protein
MVMKSRQVRRGEVDTSGKLTSEQISGLLDGIMEHKLSRTQVAEAMDVPIEVINKLYEIKLKEKEDAERSLQIPVRSHRSNTEYNSNVQKMISYKGIIRPMTLDVKNAGGGTYKLRVINIYVKPNYIKPVFDKKTGMLKEINKENTRYYEEKVYSVNKGDIMKGNSSDHYYPDKALWSKTPKEISENKAIRKSSKSAIKSESQETAKKASTLPDIIELRKKRGKRIVIKRLNRKNMIKRKIRKIVKKR